MKNKSKVVVLFLVVSLIILLGAGCSPSNGDQGSDDPEEVTIQIKLAHVCSATHPYNDAAKKFKELVESKSEGRAQVTIYPAMQLGGERDIAEGMQAGTIDINLLTLGVAASFIPEIAVFSMPFLFQNAEHFQEVMYGEIGQEFLKKVDRKNGFKTLHFGASIFRVPFNSKRPIEKPEDFQGLKLRNMEVPIHMDTYAAFGASPTPIAYTELYTALEMGTVDGAENAIGTIYADNLYEPEPIKYVTVAPVFANGVVWLYSEETWDKLPSDIQDIIIEVMPEVTAVLDTEYMNLDSYGVTQMEAKGIKINYIQDVQPFVDIVQPVWEKHLANLPDWARALIPKILEKAK